MEIYYGSFEKAMELPVLPDHFPGGVHGFFTYV